MTAGQVYEGVPTRGSKLAAVVMAEFEAESESMEAKAGAIRDVLQSGEELAADRRGR